MENTITMPNQIIFNIQNNLLDLLHRAVKEAHESKIIQAMYGRGEITPYEALRDILTFKFGVDCSIDNSDVDKEVEDFIFDRICALEHPITQYFLMD